MTRHRHGAIGVVLLVMAGAGCGSPLRPHEVPQAVEIEARPAFVEPAGPPAASEPVEVAVEEFVEPPPPRTVPRPTRPATSDSASVSAPAPAPAPTPQREPMRTDAIEEQVELTTSTTVSRIAPAFREGLEIAWWMTDDSEGAVGEALAQFTERPVPLPDEVVERWEGAGFRIVAIGEQDVRHIFETLRPIGGMQRDWVGLKSNWTECYRPPPEAKLEARRVVGLPKRVRPDRLRLIARAWSAPTPDGAVLRVDLAAQHHVPKPVFRTISLDEPGLVRTESEGEILRRVAGELSLRDVDVLLITGESPGVRWGGEIAEGEHRAGAVPAERFDPAVAEREAGNGGEFGPQIERPQQVGEAMLMAETSAIYPAPSRVIILLIPRIGEEYSLLPRE